ncbi:MAG: ATP-binding protein [Candidatus Thorarchaeota archaeon]
MQSLSRIDSRIVHFLWVVAVVGSMAYTVLIYLLPLVGALSPIMIPAKTAFEAGVCVVLMLSGILEAWAQFASLKDWSMSCDGSVFCVKIGNVVVGVSVLEAQAVAGSVIVDSEGHSRYNEMFLQAIRVGMTPHMNVAFEVGVDKARPFLRFFVSVMGNSYDDVVQSLAREAARIEAILMASLPAVDLRQLRNCDLEQAVTIVLGERSISPRGETGSGKSPGKSMLIIEGLPRTAPTQKSTQIGTFMLTLLQRGFSGNLTCVFSPSVPKRRGWRLEREWKGIRMREKQKEDSLADHSAKARLLEEYRAVQDKNAWFETSIRYIVMGQPPDAALLECMKGIIHSLWGGDSSFKVKMRQISDSDRLRIVARRHLHSQKLHVTHLSAIVHTPMELLPEISAEVSPEMPIPPKSETDNELFIGWTVYRGRPLNPVGLRPEWLREHMAVLGATGTGKTSLVKQLIAQLSLKTDVPWWIFDVKGSEYSELAGIEGTVIFKPPEDKQFVMTIVDRKGNSKTQAHATFAILRELLHTRDASADLSPAMERLLREALEEMIGDPNSDGSANALIRAVKRISQGDKSLTLTRDALLNRLEILTREPLGTILSGGPRAISFKNLLNRRVILDLSQVSRQGGMDAARILYNLVVKRIFDEAMRRGITEGLHHVVVLEEASNLVPESYSRATAADVTTGESMVMLQRATGQGVIVISTRPNISSNILANTGTKVVFRLPYDSAVGGRFLSLNPDQERYLRTLRTARALMSTPVSSTFEIVTAPFRGVQSTAGHMRDMVVSVGDTDDGRESRRKVIDSSDTMTILCERERTGVHVRRPKQESTAIAGLDISASALEAELTDSATRCECSTPIGGSVGVVEYPRNLDHLPQLATSSTKEVYVDRKTRVAKQLVEKLTRVGFLTETQIEDTLCGLDPDLCQAEVTELLQELVSLGSIEREAVGFFRGAESEQTTKRDGTIQHGKRREGFVYTLPGHGGEGVKQIIMRFIIEGFERAGLNKSEYRLEGSEIHVRNIVIVVIPETIRASELAATASRILCIYERLPPTVSRLVVVVRGSIAAAKLREYMTQNDRLCGVAVVPAFPATIERLISEIMHDRIMCTGDFETETPSIKQVGSTSSSGPTGPQIRVWINLIEKYVQINNGRARWEDVLQFVETTALQSQGRHVPRMDLDEGKRALSELLLDERLHAIRVNDRAGFVDLDAGLWVLTPTEFEAARSRTLDALEYELRSRGFNTERHHEAFDLCAGAVTYLVFPSRKRVESMRKLDGQDICPVCHSRELVCILPAIEYAEDIDDTPTNIHIVTLDSGVSRFLM